MTIATEQAIVYRGGGRRWFTLKAAVRAEVRARLRKDCECINEEAEPETGYPGYHEYCRLHEPARYEKIIRRLGRVYLRAMQSNK